MIIRLPAGSSLPDRICCGLRDPPSPEFALLNLFCLTLLNIPKDYQSGVLPGRVFPNPTAGAAILSFVEDRKFKGRVRVTDLAGNTLLNVSVQEERPGVVLNLSALPAGMYVVVAESSTRVTRYRMVKR